MLHRLVIIVAAVFMTMGGAAVAAPKGDQGPPEHAQGNGPPATPRGQANGHEKAASPQAGGQAEAPGQANARSHAKPDSGSGGSAPKGQGKTGSQEQGSSHAKAGKVTLCHATGSATNPYVEITISANALAAHQRHQDGRDIYPAPAGGCPGGTSPSGGGGGGHGNEHGKVTICHATGSETNPYVLITVDEHALKAHMSHQDGQDIVNPTGPCPGATIPTGVGNPPSGMVSPGGELPGAGPLAEAEQPAGGVLGESEEGGGGPGAAPETENAVLGANQGSGPENAVQATGDSGTSLPFTGLQLLVMAALGLVLGLAGFRLRRSAA
jgi:hypothetical protein